jgi:3',5'-cyclic AMP phosphodiesterase CpdA
MTGLVLAHVSDLHLPYEPLLSLRQRLSKRQLSAWSWRRRCALHCSEILDALVRDVHAHAVDHVVVTGDVTNFALPGEFARAAAWLETLLPDGRISVVPGNHDALVPVAAADGLGRWAAWTGGPAGFPFVHRVGERVTLIGLTSARPSAPLLARGSLGAAQLERLAALLDDEGAAGRVRIVLLHHPPAARAVGWRKALADAPAFRTLLARHGAELVLHGHARDARLDALAGPGEPIPCLCVPSSSAVPNPHDHGARWHRLAIDASGEVPRAEVAVRVWSTAKAAFVDGVRYELCLPRKAAAARRENARPGR